jgi:hypothetical protein
MRYRRPLSDPATAGKKLALRSLAFAGAVFAAGIPSAKATIISGTFDITASDFGAGAPVPTVIASFTVTLDNSVNLPNDTTSGLTVNQLNLTVDGLVSYVYYSADDELQIGGSGNSLGAAYSLSAGTNDFNAIIDFVSTSPILTSFSYATSSTAQNFGADTLSLTFTPASVPEPASLALFGTGLLGLTLFGLRRRRSP